MPDTRADFTPHPRYPELMAGMHRKPPTQVGAPAMTQHLGFWIPDSFVGNRQVWVRNIESFLLGIFDRLNSQTSFNLKTPSLFTDSAGGSRLYLLDNEYSVDALLRDQEPPSSEVGKVPSRYQTVRFSFLWHSMPVEISVELHNEYFTLSTSIDLSRWENQDAAGPALTFVEALTSLNEITSNRFQKIQETNKPIPRGADQVKLKTPYDTLYHDIWRTFCTEAFGPLCASTGGDHNIGGKFVEFRNLVLSRAQNGFIAAPGSAPKDTLLDTLERREFGELELIQCVETILPFVTLSAGESQESMEYTFSTFLNKRCLHASALGGQATTSPGGRESAHVDFFLTPYNDRWQIGRMIERGNTLGTLRVAALYDLEHLVKANGELRRLDGKLEEVSKVLSEVHNRNPALKQREAEVSRQASTTLVDTEARTFDLQQQAAKLYQISKELADAGKDISVGLLYRVERSRYYRQQFLELAETLQQNRVEGSQPYLDFVTRRLGPTFDFISMVGTRYGRLQEQVTNLHRQLNSTELIGLQTQITEAAKIIKGIQSKAEKLFFAILFPYYVASFLLYFFDEDTAWKYHILLGILGIGLIMAFDEELLSAGKWACRVLASTFASAHEAVLTLLGRLRRFITNYRAKLNSGRRKAFELCGRLWHR